MANIKLDDITERIRPAVKLVAEVGGFGDNYFAVRNTHYKNDMFLYDLSDAISNKKYKSALIMLKDEYSSLELNVGGLITEDEEIIRRVLRSEFNYQDDNFFNPKFDKNGLVMWRDSRDKAERIFKIDSSFMDGGEYLYNLRDLKSGTQVSGRLKQDELREPTAKEYIPYYEKVGMLDIHLFNKFWPLDKVPLGKKIIMLDALKGVDYEHNYKDVRELAHAAQSGLIDLNSHFNTLALLASSASFANNPIVLKTQSEETSAEEISELEKYAFKQMRILEKYKVLGENLNSLKSEIDLYLQLNPDEENVENVLKKLSTINSDYSIIDEKKMGGVYSDVALKIQKSHPEIFAKIDSLYSQTIDFVQERDIYKLNRPDLARFIKEAGLVRDLEQKDKVLFRSMSRNDSFEFHTLQDGVENAIESDVFELHVANNGFRREFFQAPCENHWGSNFGYCEGDLTLYVPKNKNEFNNRLDSAIKFYLVDEGIFTPEKMIEIRDEMRLYLKMDSIKINPSVVMLSDEQRKSAMDEIEGKSDRNIDLTQ